MAKPVSVDMNICHADHLAGCIECKSCDNATGALRARVRTLEGVLTALRQYTHEITDEGRNLEDPDDIEDYGKLRRQVAAALSGARPDTARNEAQEKLDDLAKRYVQLESDRDALREQLLAVKTERENVWLWQGDGTDAPSTLVCPVVMTAATLNALLAEQEASIVELRRALVSIDPCGGFNNHQWTDGKPCSVCGWSYETAGKVLDVVAALAQPAPQAALRAFGLRLIDVMHRRILNDEPIDGAREAIVDAVLKGES